MPSSRFALLALLFASTAWADQPWDTNEHGWLVRENGRFLSRDERPYYPPEHFAAIQADGNFVPPRYQVGDELKLMEAVRSNNVEAVRVLLKTGPNPNAQDYWRDSPLLIAVRLDNPELVQLLLDAGAKADVSGRGYTALGLAARNGSASVVRLLLQAGADPSRRNDDGDTPLHSAVRMGYVETVAALARARPNFTLFDSEGLAPLALAATTAQYAVAEILIRAGAPLERGNKHLHSPLWLAFAYSDLDMARLLLKHGAAPGKLPVESLN